MEAEQFWDTLFARGENEGYARVGVPDESDPLVPPMLAGLDYFGDVSGKRVLDLGCGRGAASLLFASRGAEVLSVDMSQPAVSNLERYCAEHGIRNVTPVCMPAQGIAELGPVDFVFGSMILHHIEPFRDFAATLRRTVAEDGKAFFWENNARSSVMIWCRENLVGRYGIPKMGDDEEFPLTPKEVDALRDHFSVEVVYPELYFFRMIPPYLLRGRFERPFAALDRFFYRVPFIRQYTYRQYLYLS